MHEGTLFAMITSQEGNGDCTAFATILSTTTAISRQASTSWPQNTIELETRPAKAKIYGLVISSTMVYLVEKTRSCTWVIWLKGRRDYRDLHMNNNRGIMAIRRPPIYSIVLQLTTSAKRTTPLNMLSHTPHPGSSSLAQYREWHRRGSAWRWRA